VSGAPSLSRLEFVGGGSLDGDEKELPVFVLEVRHVVQSSGPAFEVEVYRREGVTMKLYAREAQEV
jgi:hypothetical protein